jgi:hypothetical protein
MHAAGGGTTFSQTLWPRVLLPHATHRTNDQIKAARMSPILVAFAPGYH